MGKQLKVNNYSLHLCCHFCEAAMAVVVMCFCSAPLHLLKYKTGII